MTAIYVSGPHGGGKTTLIERLVRDRPDFSALSFDIDFLRDFTSFKGLQHWERCLVRLYHRSYLTTLADSRATADPGTHLLVSRGIRDSEAYIRAYTKLGWITPEQFRDLDFVLRNQAHPVPTVLLVPPLDTVVTRLRGRTRAGVREERDRVFRHEDTDEFTRLLWEEFAAMEGRDDVLVLRDNDPGAIEQIRGWASTL
ncbi:AAA family ATPase [Streptomyces sp. NPDC021020]|uniref:AAA family ATPase n=1 Tax=Streptomyces sp. NPDC021020 TaxID=3365109 RepID=UPI0037AA9357